jgi:nitrite reductase/ring-hydroxylating ferredoxin subunit
MNRLEFLKTAGFKGAALMALLTSCVKPEDMYVDALVQKPDGSTANPDGTIASTPVVTPVGGFDNNALITTEALNKITGSKLKLDLSTTANTKLKTKGGYIVASGIVVALSNTGQYIAATLTCSHEPKKQITYLKGEWFCTAHDARFTEAGKGLNKNGNKNLTVYKVASDGKTVVVY